LLRDYYRQAPGCDGIQWSGSLAADSGFFRFGRNVCYGRSAAGARAAAGDMQLYDTWSDVLSQQRAIHLPFDPEEIVENLQRERYSAHFRAENGLANMVLRKLYYRLRPYLSVPVRKHLQRLHLRGWEKIAFPEWPVDCTVDRLHRQLLALSMQAQGLDALPFIWFWPESHNSCAILTHDVEDLQGRDFCSHLMDIDESFGFRSSFQVVPEDRYPVSPEFLSSIVDRGFEVNVHDLKHDGRLYAEHGEFLIRAKRINRYGVEFGARGFRSGVMYRNADWYEALDFLYDMSIPNVAHLDPQRGGCCTVMPYFIGKMIELPLTCTQDYTLFNIMGDYSIDLWLRQIELIRANHGLISILVHPDYVIEKRAQNTYRNLLKYLAGVRQQDSVWTPLPGELAEWWRQRSQMTLAHINGSWQLQGPGSERATIAYAMLSGDDVSYQLEAPRTVGYAAERTN
jgi:hypothetical protein